MIYSQSSISSTPAQAPLITILDSFLKFLRGIVYSKTYNYLERCLHQNLYVANIPAKRFSDCSSTWPKLQTYNGVEQQQPLLISTPRALTIINIVYQNNKIQSLFPYLNKLSCKKVNENFEINQKMYLFLNSDPIMNKENTNERLEKNGIYLLNGSVCIKMDYSETFLPLEGNDVDIKSQSNCNGKYVYDDNKSHRRRVTSNMCPISQKPVVLPYLMDSYTLPECSDESCIYLKEEKGICNKKFDRNFVGANNEINNGNERRYSKDRQTDGNSEKHSWKNYGVEPGFNNSHTIPECSDESCICLEEKRSIFNKKFDPNYDCTNIESNSKNNGNKQSFSKDRQTDTNIEKGRKELLTPNIKKVRFNLKPKIHIMRTWNFAYRSARKGNWENIARDHSRFQLRIHRAADYLNPILCSKHRSFIFKSRFDDEN